MKVYVTGGTGFVGSHVARELREQGADVRDERVDLLDPSGLARAVEGCEAIVHVAALYSYDAPAHEIERVNVEGTGNLLEAAARQNIRRFLFTSTAGTCGPVPGRAATEDDEPPSLELEVPYKRTKLAAEGLAREAGPFTHRHGDPARGCPSIWSLLALEPMSCRGTENANVALHLEGRRHVGLLVARPATAGSLVEQ